MGRRIAGYAMLALATALAGCASRPPCAAPGDAACSGAFTQPMMPPPSQYAEVPYAPAPTAGQAFNVVATAPEVQAAQARVNAAGEGLTRAEAAGLPVAAATAMLGAQSERDAGYNGLYTGGVYSYALGVDVPLYRGGRIEAGIDAARADLRASAEAMSDRQIATAYEIAVSLLRITQQRAFIDAMQRQLNLLAKLRSDLAMERDAGAASRVDLDDVDRQVARIRVLMEQARLTISQASQAVRRLGVAETARLPETASLGLIEDDRALIDIAFRNNPRIRERAARVDAASARIVEAEGELKPSVTAGLRIAGDGGDLPSVDIINLGRAELRLSVPFDLSGAGAAGVRQRSEEKTAAQLEKYAANDGVAAAVRTANERRRQARRMLVLAQEERRAADAMLQGVRSERKVGERTTFDEIRSIENLTSAEMNLNTARYELSLAEYTLAAETGLITRLFGPVPVASAQPARW